MRITATSADAPPSHPVAWGVPVATGDDGPRYAVPLDGFDLGLPARLDPAWCKRRDFGGKVGQTLTLRSAAPAPAAPTEGGASAPAGPVSTTEIVLVGVGDPGSFEGDRGLESLRRASASFVRAAGSGESAVLLLAPVPDLPVGSSAEAAAVGAALAAYRYDGFRTADSPERLEALVLAVGSPSDVDGADGGATRGARIAESVSLARDLVNEPPSSRPGDRGQEPAGGPPTRRYRQHGRRKPRPDAVTRAPGRPRTTRGRPLLPGRSPWSKRVRPVPRHRPRWGQPAPGLPSAG